MQIKDLRFTHELDAAWIIALWKAIHEGDPSPETVAIQAIAALSRYIGVTEENVQTEQARKAFENVGINFKGPEKDEARPRQYCFTFQGKTYCVTLPVVRGPLPQ